MKFKLIHIFLVVTTIALGVGWFAERQRYVKNFARWSTEKQVMLAIFDERLLELVDGLATLESVTSLLNRGYWIRNDVELRQITNDEVCSVIISIWKHRQAMSSVINTKIGSIHQNYPQTNVAKKTGDELALGLAQQILELAKIENAEQFSAILKNSSPLKLGFVFDNKNPASDDFRAILKFADSAIKHGRD